MKKVIFFFAFFGLFLGSAFAESPYEQPVGEWQQVTESTWSILVDAYDEKQPMSSATTYISITVNQDGADQFVVLKPCNFAEPGDVQNEISTVKNDGDDGVVHDCDGQLKTIRKIFIHHLLWKAGQPPADVKPAILKMLSLE